jgi:hypothetical protein
MHDRGLIGAVAAVALAFSIGAAAADEAKYPDLKGAWGRFVVRGIGGQPSLDQTKPWGFGQEAPLTGEYQKVLRDSIADQANGGQGNFVGHAQCLPAGMPFMMVATRPFEIIVSPETTYILVGGNDHYRRIFTDGRDWPKDLEPTYSGYSIGRWIDPDGSGRYSVLEAETRNFKGPRAVDPAGLPLAFDNQSIFLERIHLDGTDSNLLHDEMTIVDHAFTRPWTVDKRYVRHTEPHQDWVESYCTEGTALVFVGKEAYYLSGDGKLMPTKPGQPAPDLTYFKPKK